MSQILVKIIPKRKDCLFILEENEKRNLFEHLSSFKKFQIKEEGLFERQKDKKRAAAQ